MEKIPKLLDQDSGMTISPYGYNSTEEEFYIQLNVLAEVIACKTKMAALIWSAAQLLFAVQLLLGKCFFC